MKKYFVSVLLLLIVPGMCFGASARYTQLVREKQRKMEQLEKCMGTNKGLQIAGISTLGLTAVGVAGNIAEANIIKKNDKTLEKQNTTLAEKEEEYNRKENARKDAEKERNQAKTDWENANKLRVFVQRDIDDINNLEVTIGTQVFVSGYDSSALPAGDLKQNLATALIGVIRKCKSLERDGIKTVSLQEERDKPTWGDDDGTLDLEAVWTETTPRQVMVCNLIECDEPTYYRAGNQCIKKESSENKDAVKDGKSDKKSGGQKSQSDKNGGNQQGGAAVVPGSKKKGSGSSDKDICENSENGGTWMGTTCNCGTEKFWNTKNKRCEGFDEEETGPDIQKKNGDQCDTAWLTQHNATRGVYLVAEGETELSCFIQECKHGYHPTLKGKNYNITEGLNDEVVCTKDATGPQKCSQSALNAIKAKDGIVEGGKCKVTTCKGNLRKTTDNLNCECPGNDYKWNETKQTCEKNTPAAPVIKNDKWTLEQIKSSSNQSDACKNHFIAGQTLGETGPAYNCCMEIVNGKASSYDGASQKCNCKSDFKWENNKCVEKKNIKDLKGATVYYKKDFSTYKATIDNVEFIGSVSGVSASSSTRDAAALKDLKEKINAAGYINYHLTEEKNKDLQGRVIYYTKDFSTFKATVDGVEYKGRSHGMSASASTRDAASLKILKEQLDAAGYTNYELAEEK